MKDSYRHISLAKLCRLLGVTRQAYYQHFWAASDTTTQEELVLKEVQQLRKLHPALGGRKLYYLLQPFFMEHQIKLGRDGLFDLLACNGLLVRRKRRCVKTTQSRHWLKKYPNLTRQWKPTAPHQLWVADITYVPIKYDFAYLSLITDAYSHKILGYQVADNLSAIHTLDALKMALKGSNAGQGIIHHSDRGIQYCSTTYVEMMKRYNLQISMSEDGDPLENAVAERINGIIKNEYLQFYRIISIKDLKQLMPVIIERYNCKRPHLSIQMLTPEHVHTHKLLVNRSWAKKQTPNIVNPIQEQ